MDRDEPCDPRELGPSTAPGLSRREQAASLARKVLRLREAEWTREEIAAELDIYPDHVSRLVRRASRKSA